MEFLCVGSTKLKVVLTREECEEFKIKPDSAECSDRAVRGVIRSILDRAEEATGFSVGNEKLLIQLYPLEAGCELFITKLSHLGERERRAIAESEYLSTYRESRTFYCFSSLEDLICAARGLRHRELQSDLYYSNSGEYYLSVRESTLDGVSDCMLLSEYGSRINALPLGICGEWGRLLIKGRGIDILSRL